MSDPQPYLLQSATMQSLPAPAPAGHQVAAFNGEKLVAKAVMVLGAIVTAGGALTSVFGDNAKAAMWIGAVVTCAGTLQHALAHATFQNATGT